MHKLQNGSQVAVRPARKPQVGTGGYFAESNDGGAPSYPGQDWFNDCTDEFLNALAAGGITYNPLQTEHLAQLFSLCLNRGAFALVSFNGITGLIDFSFNVSGVIKNSTGDYTVQFNNDANINSFIVSLSSGLPQERLGQRTVSTVRFTLRDLNDLLQDSSNICVAIFGGNL